MQVAEIRRPPVEIANDVTGMRERDDRLPVWVPSDCGTQIRVSETHLHLNIKMVTVINQVLVRYTTHNLSIVGE